MSRLTPIRLAGAALVAVVLVVAFSIGRDNAPSRSERTFARQASTICRQAHARISGLRPLVGHDAIHAGAPEVIAATVGAIGALEHLPAPPRYAAARRDYLAALHRQRTLIAALVRADQAGDQVTVDRLVAALSANALRASGAGARLSAGDCDRSTHGDPEAEPRRSGAA